MKPMRARSMAYSQDQGCPGFCHAIGSVSEHDGCVLASRAMEYLRTNGCPVTIDIQKFGRHSPLLERRRLSLNAAPCPDAIQKSGRLRLLAGVCYGYTGGAAGGHSLARGKGPLEDLMSPFSPAPDPGGIQRVERADVLRQLDRILSHPLFLNSARLSAFLRYSVETTLAGKADSLKELVIAAEVFRRGDSFDPQTDNLVRVTANRLRSKLAEYYHRSGRSDRVMIDLPRGGYAASFSAATPPVRSAVQAGVVAGPRISVGRERERERIRAAFARHPPERGRCWRFQATPAWERLQLSKSF